jgi:AcrR family transcriptional regulator
MARVTPADRREMILKAAREEFAARGFAAARMDDIAARVGISKAALYLQFSDKYALFKTLVETLVAGSLLQMLPRDLAGQSAAELLRAFVETALDRLTKGDIAFLPRLIIGEGGNFPELAKFHYDLTTKQVLASIEAVIRHGILRGEFRPVDTYHVARSVMGAVLLGSLWKTVFEPAGGDLLDTQALANAHLDVLLGGLRLRNGESV